MIRPDVEVALRSAGINESAIHVSVRWSKNSTSAIIVQCCTRRREEARKLAPQSEGGMVSQEFRRREDPINSIIRPNASRRRKAIGYLLWKSAGSRFVLEGHSREGLKRLQSAAKKRNLGHVAATVSGWRKATWNAQDPSNSSKRARRDV